MMNKNIYFEKNIDSNLIFKGGSLIDWEIFFEDRSKDAPKFINDINGMTGCLNFLDMTVKKFKIKCWREVNVKTLLISYV